MFVEFKVRPLPSVCVKVVSESAPKDNTALSVISLRSSPTVKSAPTPTPPPTTNAPSDALVLAVVAETVTTPPEDIAIASVAEAEPMFPPSGISRLPLRVSACDELNVAAVEPPVAK